MSEQKEKVDIEIRIFDHSINPMKLHALLNLCFPDKSFRIVDRGDKEYE